MELGVILGVVGLLMGTFGWSHASLRKQDRVIEHELALRPTKEEIRQLIRDLSAPQRIEFEVLTRRIDKLEAKIDRLLDVFNDNRK